jgi:hypothetical protein
MDQIKNQSPFLEEVRKVLRVQYYAIRTEQSYVEWIKRFILFHNKRHPNEMGESEVAIFLTHLYRLIAMWHPLLRDRLSTL